LSTKVILEGHRGNGHGKDVQCDAATVRLGCSGTVLRVNERARQGNKHVRWLTCVGVVAPEAQKRGQGAGSGSGEAVR
jgi:hypothetical protein